MSLFQDCEISFKIWKSQPVQFNLKDFTNSIIHSWEIFSENWEQKIMVLSCKGHLRSFLKSGSWKRPCQHPIQYFTGGSSQCNKTIRNNKGHLYRKAQDKITIVSLLQGSLQSYDSGDNCCLYESTSHSRNTVSLI